MLGSSKKPYAIATNLLKLDRRAGSLEGFLDFLGLVFVDAFFDRSRDALNEVFGVLKAQAGLLTHGLDDLDFLLTEAGENDVELGLLFGGSGRASGRASGDGDSSGSLNAPLVLELGDQFTDLHDAQVAQKLNDLLFCNVSHFQTPANIAPDSTRGMVFVICGAIETGQSGGFVEILLARIEQVKHLRGYSIEKANEVGWPRDERAQKLGAQLVFGGHFRQLIDPIGVQHSAVEVSALEDDFVILCGVGARDFRGRYGVVEAIGHRGGSAKRVRKDFDIGSRHGELRQAVLNHGINDALRAEFAAQGIHLIHFDPSVAGKNDRFGLTEFIAQSCNNIFFLCAFHGQLLIKKVSPIKNPQPNQRRRLTNTQTVLSRRAHEQ